MLILERTRIMTMTFGEWVRLRREEQGMPQRELGHRLNLDPAYISRIERNYYPTRTGMPEPEEARRWAAALGTTVDDMVEALGYSDRVPVAESPAQVFASMTTRVQRTGGLPPRLKRIILEALAEAEEVVSHEAGGHKPD